MPCENMTINKAALENELNETKILHAQSKVDLDFKRQRFYDQKILTYALQERIWKLEEKLNV